MWDKCTKSWTVTICFTVTYVAVLCPHYVSIYVLYLLLWSMLFSLFGIFMWGAHRVCRQLPSHKSGLNFFPAVHHRTPYNSQHTVTVQLKRQTSHLYSIFRIFQWASRIGIAITKLLLYSIQDVFLASLWSVSHVFSHAADSPWTRWVWLPLLVTKSLRKHCYSECEFNVTQLMIMSQNSSNTTFFKHVTHLCSKCCAPLSCRMSSVLQASNQGSRICRSPLLSNSLRGPH